LVTKKHNKSFRDVGGSNLELVSLDNHHSYLGSFSTNYIISRNEFFSLKFKDQIFVKRKMKNLFKY
jgi:hypothetical protein